jgi:hypothetical protein
LAGRIKVGANLKWGDIDTGAGKVWLRTTDDQVFAVIDAETMAIKARRASRREAAACASAQGHLDLRPRPHTLTWWPRPESLVKPAA